MTFKLSLLMLVLWANLTGMNPGIQDQLAVDGFSNWYTGHDTDTRQLVPVPGADPLYRKDGITLAHVKFIVHSYGELAFPIAGPAAVSTEARGVDISGSKFIAITYKANRDLVLQLRQTGVHGGHHNYVALRASPHFKEHVIPLSEFKNGPAPLDLSNVSKFNFAFIGKGEDKFSELVVRSFRIDGFDPSHK